LLFDLPSRVWRSEVFASRGERFVLLRARFTGEAGRGAPIVVEHLSLVEWNAEGRRTAFVLFDRERVDLALAELELRAASEVAPALVENLATASLARFTRAWKLRDFEGVAATFAPAFQLTDRRRTVNADLDRSSMLASLRQIFDAEEGRLGGAEGLGEVVATRGDRLALQRAGFSIRNGGSGPSEFAYLSLLEVDAAGQRTAMVLFEPEAEEAAIEELDRRHAQGELARHPHAADAMRRFRAAFAKRDWDALGAIFADELVVHDHRRLGWDTLRGRKAYLDALRSLIDLSPDVQLRLEHARTSEHGMLWVASWTGTREGGPFEAPWVTVAGHDGDGRVARFDQYDLAQLPEAQACFEALGGDPLRIPPNAAIRCLERMFAANVAGDRAAFEALYAPELVFDDRRRLNRLRGGRDLLVATNELMAGVQSSRTVLATMGDRLVMSRMVWSGTAATPYEVEVIDVVEVDEAGRIVALLAFDTDDRRAASRELFDRYFRGEGARYAPPSFVEFLAALDDHDAARARAALPDGFVFHDRRRIGVGRLGNADEYVASLAAIWEQSSDVHAETLYHVAVAPHGALSVGRWFGTTGGGEFESLFVRLVQYGAASAIRAELFELEDLELARARFEELRPSLSIPANASTRVIQRMVPVVEARDWVRLESMLADRLTFEDRRPGFLLSGDRSLLLDNLRVLGSAPVLTKATPLAVFGERIAIHRFEFRAAEGAPPFEVETLQLDETDGNERLLATIVFEPGDRAGAWEEAQRRLARHERIPPNAATRAAERNGAFLRAGDWEGLRAFTAPDFQFDDRRKLAMVSGGVDMYVENLQVVHAYPGLSTRREVLCTAGDRVALAHLRYEGGSPGSEFRGEFLLLLEVAADGKVRAAIHFDPEDRAAAFAEAQARFVAGEAAGIAAQASVSALVRAVGRHDWATLRACFADDARIADHRSIGLLGEFDVDGWIDSLRALTDLAGDLTSEALRILAWNARGRASLVRLFGTRDGGAFESLLVSVTLAEDGRIECHEFFDAAEADRALARFAELTG
jgi:ketosteroid isomerase-like protein